MVPFADTTPPASMVKTLLDGQVPWVLKLAEKLPRLSILKSDVQPKGAGIYAVTVWVENAGYLPFPTAMGKKNLHVPPAVVTLATKDNLKGVTFLSGKKRTTINAIDGGRSVKLEWLVQAPAVPGFEVVLESANAGVDVKFVNLAGGPGGAK